MRGAGVRDEFILSGPLTVLRHDGGGAKSVYGDVGGGAAGVSGEETKGEGEEHSLNLFVS